MRSWFAGINRRYLFEVVHFKRQLLQRAQDELQQRAVVGGFGVSQPGVQEPVAANSDKPAGRRGTTAFITRQACNGG